MTLTRIMAVVLVLVGTVVAVASWRHTTQTEATTPDTFRFDARSLSDTTMWTKVNAAPYHISSELDLLCARPAPADYVDERKKNPHSATSITVFVNSVGRSAMFQKESPEFPQGSVIVKQKNGRFSERNTIILYTIMRKREAGYNPSVGDWEFSVVNADGSTVEASGKIENCQGCHVKKTTSDFLFRSYVDFK